MPRQIDTSHINETLVDMVVTIAATETVDGVTYPITSVFWYEFESCADAVQALDDMALNNPKIVDATRLVADPESND